MTVVKLLASTYGTSNTSVVQVTNPGNMYTDVSSTTYTTITTNQSNTTTYYCYLRGFDFSGIPSDAIINSYKIRVRGYVRSLSTGTSYAPKLCNNTSGLSGTEGDSFGTTNKTIELNTANVSFNTLRNYGADLGIMLTVKRSNKNTSGLMYIYGAEIEVDYTENVQFNVTVQNSSSLEVSPTGSQSLLTGSNFTLKIDAGSLDEFTITDNGNDVSSLLSFYSSGTYERTVHLNSLDTVATNTEVTNSANAYTDITDESYAQIWMGSRTSASAVFNFNTEDFPVDGIVNSISCIVRNRTGTNGNITTKTMQLYSGTTPKGSVSQIPTSDQNTTMDVGSWTMAELREAKLRINGYVNSTTRYYSSLRGANLTVNYENPHSFFTYELEGLNGDHTIIIQGTSGTLQLKLKVNGSWILIQKAYKKAGNSWVEQSNLATLFTSDNIYVKG